MAAAGSKFQAGILGSHLLLSPTIMTSLWKPCAKIWLYDCSSRQWAECHLGISISLNWSDHFQHTVSRNNLKRFFKTFVQHTGKAVCTGGIYYLWFSYLAPKKRIRIHCCICQAMWNAEISACVHSFLSDITKNLTLFNPTVSLSHTLSLMGRFPLDGAWIRLSLSKMWSLSCGAWVKWDCHSKISWDRIIMLWYSNGKFSWHSHAHRYAHTCKDSQ